MSLKQLNMDFGPNYNEHGIIGYSEKISEVITIIKTVAPTGLSVLISGETINSVKGKIINLSLLTAARYRKV